MEAFGGYGEYVTRPEEIRPALKCSFNSGKASLINVVTDHGEAAPGVRLAGSAGANEVLIYPSHKPCKAFH